MDVAPFGNKLARVHNALQDLFHYHTDDICLDGQRQPLTHTYIHACTHTHTHTHRVVATSSGAAHKRTYKGAPQRALQIFSLVKREQTFLSMTRKVFGIVGLLKLPHAEVIPV